MLAIELIFVPLLGGVTYCLIETIYRRYTHWTMLLVGGLCFLCIYMIGTRTTFHALIQCLLGVAVITGIEFLSGYILNIRLNWNIWDYSAIRYNVLGQICPLYMLCWFFLCLPGIAVAQFINGLLVRLL